jgi:hypothetical protein
MAANYDLTHSADTPRKGRCSDVLYHYKFLLVKQRTRWLPPF